LETVTGHKKLKRFREIKLKAFLGHNGALKNVFKTYTLVTCM
jgi:hypothetical protein